MKKIIALITTLAALTAQLTVFAAGSANETVTDYDPSAITAAATPAPTEAAEEPAEDGIETSVIYQAYETIAGYIAERYLDDSYTTEDIMKIGLSEYLAEQGDEALVGLLKAALHKLDDYSDFFTHNEYIEYNNQLNKTFYGLGVTLQQDGEYTEITGFAQENSLAEKSGFKPGDRIVKVDGINVVGNSVTEVRNLIVGELGTTVLITVERDGQTIEITGTRTAVNSSTVSGGILEGNIGYIKIASFSSGTADEFAGFQDMLTENGITNLILDLRNNPGGLVAAATTIAENLIPAGTIVDVRYRDESMNFTYASKLDKAPFKIVALINEHTASSAEILASSIQDSGTGILMGQQSFGKAVIQSTFPLKNGMVFKLTIGQYITRNGNEIDHVGLTPDIAVENYTKRIDTTGYTKFDFITPASVGSSGTNVSVAKERLAVMGYYIGNRANDVFNTDLADAIKAFQKENGLTDSGVLDVATQIKIKEVFEMLETMVDVQMQEAYKYFGGNIDNLY